MDYIISAISKSDAVFVATSAPHIIVTQDTIRSAGERDRPLIIVDVSVPKNVDDSVGEIDNVILETMDGLKGVAIENIRKRSMEILDAERIVTEELTKIDIEQLEEKADHIIGEISRKASAIREEEVSRARVRAASADINEVFDDMSRAIVAKILANTYERLRSSSVNGESAVIDAAKDLFGVKVK
jgi:glutamyl-tRNA reductase